MATDLLSFGLASHPEKAAVICDERSLSFLSVHRRANCLVEYFRESGLKIGDRVALVAKNEIQYLEIQVACMRAGLILVPINFRLAPPEISYILNDSTPGLVIAGHEFGETLAGIDAPPTLLLDQEYEKLVSGENDRELDAIDLNRDCTILYTSGTTGRPKGAVLTNQALYSRINANYYEYRVRPTDVFLQCLPLFHIASNVTWSYACGGATNIFLKEFHPLAVLDLIEKYNVTTALLVPTMINTLIHQPEVEGASLSSLDKIAYGASSIPPSVLSRAIDLLGCGFLQLYGMTETSATTVLRPEQHDPINRPDLLPSAGTAGVGMDVRIVDDDDRELAPGEIGEIACRGEVVMRGYWGNDAATAEVLKNGWMHTGDLGYKDSEGFYFVTDRKKDLIISGGENVYPREVEDVLYEHPDILEAAVIGVPDDKWGERVHAVIVAQQNRELELDDIIAFTRERLAGYKVPKTAELMAELPKNATGKVLKTELRKTTG
ncbi:MAG: long-chain-fatty-acid--CoA ligase [Gammaproteobacteria bacterium]|nr:long-chain-fatty-acid--CoA ligase [Gammaproteobacteria bacterium]